MKVINKLFYCFLVFLNNFRFVTKFKKIYGQFSKLKGAEKYSLKLNNESSLLHGEIVKMIEALPSSPKRVLLAGEENDVREAIKRRFSFLEDSQLKTAGLGKNVDYKWDFENSPPPFGKFSLIISQAILEHLVDPYKHIKDLADSLEKGGCLIIHSEMPGFKYHRYPIDALRFNPDWFEEIAKPSRCNLTIKERFIRGFHIFYKYQNN